MYFFCQKHLISSDVKKLGRIHGVEDILLGFEPKDAGSIPAGSVTILPLFRDKKMGYSTMMNGLLWTLYDHGPMDSISLASSVYACTRI